jgi:hypothetical protein
MKKKHRRVRNLNILGIVHKVRHIKIQENNDGYYSAGLIEINREIVDKPAYLKTLIHEGLHGVFEVSGIHQDITLPQEHTIIDSTIAFLFTNFDIDLKKK